VEHLPKKQVVDEGSLPGVIQAEVSGDVLPQCVACEYAGCICIVVVIVVPTVTAIADSSNIEKTRIFFISNYKDIPFIGYLFLFIRYNE
jgi:hypothetical protein